MAKEEAAPESAGAPKKGKGGMMLIVGLVLLLALNGLIVMKVMANRPSTPPKPKPEEVGAMVNLDEFVLNVLNGGWLTTKITLGLKKDVTAEKMQDEVAPIRDAVIGVLTTKSQAELATPQAREKLKDELRDKINQELGGSKVLKIYFTSFAMQRAD